MPVIIRAANKSQVENPDKLISAYLSVVQTCESLIEFRLHYFSVMNAMIQLAKINSKA